MSRIKGGFDRLCKRFGTWDWAALALIVLASFALRWYRIDDALVGYHASNEGFYTDLGTQYLNSGAFAPFSAPLDTNNPPFYLFIVRLVFNLVGSSLAMARAVSVIASVMTVVAVFLLGRDLYGQSAGLLAAVIFGLSPGAVLVGGNAQVEGLMVLLIVSSLLAFERAQRKRNIRLALISGFLLGLAVLTKLPAIMLLPAILLWEMWGVRSMEWLKRSYVHAFLTSFGLTAVPWYLFRYVIDSSWRQGQAYLFGTLELPTWQTLTLWLGSELFWLVSPIVFIALIFAVAMLVLRRRQSDMLVLFTLGMYMLFYLFYSFHTYYLLPAVPLAAVAVGAFAEYVGATSARRSLPLVVFLALVLSVSAAVMVGGKKWGGLYSSDVRDIIVHTGYHPEDVVLAVDREVLDSWEPALHDALPDTEVVSWPLQEMPGSVKPILHLKRYDEVQSMSGGSTVPHRRHGPVAFGYTVMLPDTNALHFFGVVDAEFVRVGPWWRFGVANTMGPSKMRVEVVRP